MNTENEIQKLKEQIQKLRDDFEMLKNSTNADQIMIKYLAKKEQEKQYSN
jgi:hypothetical protein